MFLILIMMVTPYCHQTQDTIEWLSSRLHSRCIHKGKMYFMFPYVILQPFDSLKYQNIKLEPVIQ